MTVAAQGTGCQRVEFLGVESCKECIYCQQKNWCNLATDVGARKGLIAPSRELPAAAWRRQMLTKKSKRKREMEERDKKEEEDKEYTLATMIMILATVETIILHSRAFLETSCLSAVSFLFTPSPNPTHPHPLLASG